MIIHPLEIVIRSSHKYFLFWFIYFLTFTLKPFDVNGQNIQSSKIFHYTSSLENKWNIVSYNTDVFLDGRKINSRHSTLIYHKKDRLIKFCLLEKEQLINSLYILDDRKVITFANNISSSDTSDISNIKFNFESLLIPEIIKYNNYTTNLEKIVFSNKGKNEIETYFQHQFYFTKGKLNYIMSDLNQHIKGDWVQKISEINIEEIDSFQYDSMLNSFKKLFESKNYTGVSSQVLYSELLKNNLKDVLLNSNVQIDTGLSIIDFSFTSCGPCWKNFTLLENNFKGIIHFPVYIIDPNYVKSRDYSIVKTGLSDFFTYCKVQSPIKISSLIKTYPQLLIVKNNKVIYTHVGLLTQNDIAYIKQLLKL